MRLTQEQVAGVARVSPRLLGEVERGKGTAQLNGLMRIFVALGLELRIDPR